MSYEITEDSQLLRPRRSLAALPYEKLNMTEDIAYQMLEALLKYDRTFNPNQILTRERGSKESLLELIDRYPMPREMREKLIKLAEKHGTTPKKVQTKTLRKKKRSR